MPATSQSRKWMPFAFLGAALVGVGMFVFYLSAGTNQPPPPMPMAESEKNEKPTANDMNSMMEMDMEQTTMPSASDSVMVSPRKQQLIGVKTTKAQVRSLSRSMRTVGQIEVDERLLEHVHIKLEGWIEKLYVRFTGRRCQKRSDAVRNL